LTTSQDKHTLALTVEVEGVADTRAVVFVLAPNGVPHSVTLAAMPLTNSEYSAEHHVLWIQFTNESRPRELVLRW